MRALIATAAVLLSSQALAAPPEDVSLSSMSTYRGVPVVDPVVLGDAYELVVKQLGVAVGTRVPSPAHTLGASGFELAVENTFGFNQSTRAPDGAVPAWARVHEDEDPAAFLNALGVSMRKGLPFSTEIGIGARWLVNSHQAVISGWGRIGLVENWRPWPDISVHVGYHHYVGNPELQLGTWETGITVGTSLPFGANPKVRQASFSPFADFNLLTVAAAPTIDPELASEIGAVAYGRHVPAGIASTKALVIPQLQGGFEIKGGGVFFRFAGGWAFGTMATANAAFGFAF